MTTKTHETPVVPVVVEQTYETRRRWQFKLADDLVVIHDVTAAPIYMLSLRLTDSHANFDAMCPGGWKIVEDLLTPLGPDEDRSPDGHRCKFTLTSEDQGMSVLHSGVILREYGNPPTQEELRPLHARMVAWAQAKRIDRILAGYLTPDYPALAGVLMHETASVRDEFFRLINNIAGELTSKPLLRADRPDYIPEGTKWWRWCLTQVRGRRVAMWWNPILQKVQAYDPHDDPVHPFTHDDPVHVFIDNDAPAVLKNEMESFAEELIASAKVER